MSEQAVNGQAPPDIALGDELQDGGEFLGVVMVDEWTQTKEGKWQWHLGVRPTDFDIQGETQMFHSWYTHSDRKRSKMGAAREAMMGLPDLFPPALKIGRGEMIGKACIWTRRDIDYGTDKTTGEKMIAESVLIPLRAAEPADVERAVAKAGKPNAGTSAAPVVEAAQDVGELDSDTLDTVLKLIDGKTKAEIQFAVARNKELSREVKQGLLSETIQQGLIEAGLIHMQDGKVSRLGVAV